MLMLTLFGLVMAGWWLQDQAWTTLRTPINGFTLAVLAMLSVSTIGWLWHALHHAQQLSVWLMGPAMHALTQACLGVQLGLSSTRPWSVALVTGICPFLIAVLAWLSWRHGTGKTE